ncbi:MAG: TolC family protein [Saprospiraceae bacterium]|nr:TolC family protein [Saprospiraceae bacterium]
MKQPQQVFRALLFAASLTATAPLHGQTVLTITECRNLALQNSPLLQKKEVASAVSALQIRNLKSNNLPRINVNGQASYQSDVVSFPFTSPTGSPLLVIPKDQYRLALDVAERLYDGGSDRIMRQQKNLDVELTAAQVDVETYQLRELVTDLFFKALLLQESAAVLKTSKEDLERRQKQAEGAVAEGVALRTTVDQVKVQILKTDQQIAALDADRQAILDILGKWVGKDVRNMNLEAPLSAPAALPAANVQARPEIRLFDVQNRQLGVGKDALSLRKQPKVELFAQGGLGRPNPFNFFETDLDPFAIVGLRASWTPIDWGNTRREAQAFDLQKKYIDIQNQAFQQRFEAGYLKDQSDYTKWVGQLKQDDAIIALQEDIVERADAQVKNGVMTATDYLAQLNLLTQARLTRKTHEIQAAQAREMWNAKTGSD